MAIQRIMSAEAVGASKPLTFSLACRAASVRTILMVNFQRFAQHSRAVIGGGPSPVLRQKAYRLSGSAGLDGH
ncbi:MAG: hypothetical protein ACI9S9_004878 [Planctomycetota bacterium]|jgi:hypothetical protein